ncbi:MAG: hypothetical protein ABIO92_02995 [Chloroflexia bacterium]
MYRKLFLGILSIALLQSAVACSSGTAPTATSTLVSEPATSTPASNVVSPATPSAEMTLPVAPESARVDLIKPSFSNPTNVTNPLYPISKLQQIVLLGKVEGRPFRSEVTLLPGTKEINWDGQTTKTLISQYVAYIDGRIVEAAHDWYAQANDGAVWYFGEDVFNFKDGVIADTEGTWLAGKDGPAAMIMPANPRVGDVYRVENIPGLVFEEVTVKSTGVIVDGPHGPVKGTMVGDQLHMDGTHADKTFAPGYAEFVTGKGADIEAVALAIPTDALSGSMPTELKSLSTEAYSIFETAKLEDWPVASDTLGKMTTAWGTYKAGNNVPKLLSAQMSEALDALTGAVKAQNSALAWQAALGVAQASLDFQLQYRPPTEIDLARFDLWTRQLLRDAAAGDLGAVKGDVATLEYIQDRVAHTLGSDAGRIATLVEDLRAAADAKDLSAAINVTVRLRDVPRLKQ